MGALTVLDEDQARLTQIETNVNAQRVALSLAPLPGGDIIAGCVQVGLNALTDGRDAPNTRTTIPSLSIVGLPGSGDTVVFSDELDDRIAAISTALDAPVEDVTSLALHAGCLVMLGETANHGYRADFGS
jgi:hypothetical protein